MNASSAALFEKLIFESFFAAEFHFSWILIFLCTLWPIVL